MSSSLGGSMGGSCLQQRPEGYPAYVFHEPLHSLTQSYSHAHSTAAHSQPHRGIPTSHGGTPTTPGGPAGPGGAPYQPTTSTATGESPYTDISGIRLCSIPFRDCNPTPDRTELIFNWMSRNSDVCLLEPCRKQEFRFYECNYFRNYGRLIQHKNQFSYENYRKLFPECPL